MGVLITLNETTVINDGRNSSYTYTFPNGGYRFQDDMIALSSFSNFNSTVNISASLGNNLLNYGWPTGPPSNGIISCSNTIPDGNYTISQLNAFFQSCMYARGQYFITTTGNITYCMVLSYEPSTQRVYLNTYNLNVNEFPLNQFTIPPTPQGQIAWVRGTNTPYLDLLIDGTFRQLIGFAPANYPSSISSPSSIFSGTQQPEIVAIKTININCSLVNNRTSIPNNLLYAFAPSENMLSQNLYQPQANFVWVKIKDGVYNEFKIELRNSLNNTQIVQSNPQMTLVLYIKNKNEFSQMNL